MTGQDRPDSQALSRWRRVQAQLQAEVGETTFINWLSRLDFVEHADSAVVLSVPTRFMRDWVAPRFGDRIRAIWQRDDPAIESVEIVVRLDGGGDDVGDACAPADEAAAVKPAVRPPVGPRASGPLEELENTHATLDPRFSFENFIVGKPNEFAHAAARRVAEHDDVPFNPLFIYGGVGLGKTHLMHAITWRICERRPDRKVIYLSIKIGSARRTLVIQVVP